MLYRIRATAVQQQNGSSLTSETAGHVEATVEVERAADHHQGSSDQGGGHASTLVTSELARVQCAEPPTSIVFAATAGGSVRLIALAHVARVWSRRLHSSQDLPLRDGHVAKHLAVATSSMGAPSLIAVASEHRTDFHAMREIRVLELGGPRGDTPTERRALILPASIHAMAFCGERYLCVAHRSENLQISLATGSVR